MCVADMATVSPLLDHVGDADVDVADLCVHAEALSDVDVDVVAGADVDGDGDVDVESGATAAFASYAYERNHRNGYDFGRVHDSSLQTKVSHT